MGVVVILGTGGTIAGTGADPTAPWRYTAAQLPISQLMSGLPELSGVPFEARQVVQVDSKDMGWRVWQALGLALATELAREEVDGVVITHGTDTLEETALLLHHLVDVSKPVVLTAAMRPATAPDADGPGNLRDAVSLVREAAAQGRHGVVAVLAGRAWAARNVRKAHSHALDAFDGGGAPALAETDSHGQWPVVLASWPAALGYGWALLAPARPPRVEWVSSHADADGWLVDALLARSAAGEPAERLRGLVVAGTGHGTLHQGLQAALQRAEQAGVLVWRSSRVARGGVLAREGDHWPAAGLLTAAQARVALVLTLLRESAGATLKAAGQEAHHP